MDTPQASFSARPAGQLKKRRNPNACDICRKKKIKCDAALMPGNRCSECISYNCECVRSKVKSYHNYRISKPPKASRAPEISPRDQTSTQDIIEEERPALHPLVKTAISLLPDRISASANDAMSRISSHIFNIERQLSDLRASAASSSGSIFLQPDNSPLRVTNTNAEVDPNEDDGDETAQLVEQLSELHLKPFHGTMGKHFGPSSTISLVGMTLRVILESNKDPTILDRFRGIRRPFFWNPLPWEAELQDDIPLHNFPPTSLMYDLLELYFTEVNVLFPLLHKPSFLRAINNNEHILDPNFGEVVLGVCALASRWSENPAVVLEADEFGHSAGWRWFRQIRLFKRITGRPPSVHELQSNLLCILYLGGSSQFELAGMLLGISMRFAVEIGAHRKVEQPSLSSELMKRAFWTFWCYDGMLSSFLGRPRTTLAEELDVEMPIDCDDEYLEIDDPELAFKQPPGKPSQMSGFIAYIRLVQVLEHAQTDLFSVKAQKSLRSGEVKAQDVVAQIDSELNQWHDAVPAHLTWEQFQSYDVSTVSRLSPIDSIFYKQAAILQCTYHYTHILAHRPFLFSLKPNSPMFVSSWAVCTTGARACIRILKVSQPFMTFHFLPVANAVVIILEKWKVGGRSSNAASTHQARELVETCLQISKKFENRWFFAGKMVDVIAEVMYLDDLVSRSSTSPRPSSPEMDIPRPEDIFSMATRSLRTFPTFDVSFLNQNFLSSEEEFSMMT